MPATRRPAAAQGLLAAFGFASSEESVVICGDLTRESLRGESHPIWIKASIAGAQDAIGVSSSKLKRPNAVRQCPHRCGKSASFNRTGGRSSFTLLYLGVSSFELRMVHSSLFRQSSPTRRIMVAFQRIPKTGIGDPTNIFLVEDASGNVFVAGLGAV